MNGVRIKGVGKAVPNKKVTNEELATFLDTSDEWITSRTGIHSRYIAIEETTTSLAIQAAQAAIADAKIDPHEIDMIIVATITPDEMMPSTACRVQYAIDAKQATAFDISAACSGFLYGSKIAVESIRSGGSKTVLVIGAEVLSKALNWEDRSTCVLFGDGAGAAIYQQDEKNHIVNVDTGSDGSLGDVLGLPSMSVQNHFVKNQASPMEITMDGKEVYRFATTVVPRSIEKVLEDTAYTLEDIDCFILHQANSRIMDSVAKKLSVPNEKFFKNLNQYGNTSSATIPIALCEAKEQLEPGSKVILCGFGGGLTWGSMLVILD